jgi:hypothetical protein
MGDSNSPFVAVLHTGLGYICEEDEASRPVVIISAGMGMCQFHLIAVEMPDGSYIPVGGVHYDAFSVRRLAQEISLLPNGIQEYAGNLSDLRMGRELHCRAVKVCEGHGIATHHIRVFAMYQSTHPFAADWHSYGLQYGRQMSCMHPPMSTGRWHSMCAFKPRKNKSYSFFRACAFNASHELEEAELEGEALGNFYEDTSSAPALGAADWNKLSMQTKTGRRAKHDAREAVLIEENPESAEMIQINVVHRQQTMESLCGAPLRRDSAEQIAVQLFFQRRALQK